MEKIPDENLVDSVKKVTAWFKSRYGRKVEPQIFEEFEGWVCEQYLSGRSLKTNYEWIAIDFLRKFALRTGARGGTDALHQPGRVGGEDSESIFENNKQTAEKYRGPDSLDKSKRRGSLGAYLERCRDLRLSARLILILRYEWEFTLREIGYVMGVSESRVSQMHDEILRAQKKAQSQKELSEKQKERKSKESRKVSRALQERSRLSAEEKRILAVLCERKRIGMGEGKIEKIPETLQGAFAIRSF